MELNWYLILLSTSFLRNFATQRLLAYFILMRSLLIIGLVMDNLFFCLRNSLGNSTPWTCNSLLFQFNITLSSPKSTKQAANHGFRFYVIVVVWKVLFYFSSFFIYLFLGIYFSRFCVSYEQAPRTVPRGICSLLETISRPSPNYY